ncbi:DUF4280 domain-containing protein [Zobellia roscoffensis]|uniref:DUF4280 domain-containing protein n=1 Tax=Zobellia roscoffensis TaxID=2779508 RepID=UPI00188B64E5|nr:DUF4280 domain-containing protein [Zobellia roscoffensis]
MANKKYVPQGTYLACDKGTVPMEFMITNNNNSFLFDEPVANTGDMVPMVNVQPMGVCTVTSSACVPAPIMWDGFEDGIFVGFFNPLLEDSVLPCGVGGKIEIFYSLEDATAACAEEESSFWETLGKVVLVVAAVALIVVTGGAALAAIAAIGAASGALATGIAVTVAALEVAGCLLTVKALYDYSQDGDEEALFKEVALGFLFLGAGKVVEKVGGRVLRHFAKGTDEVLEAGGKGADDVVKQLDEVADPPGTFRDKNGKLRNKDGTFAKDPKAKGKNSNAYKRSAAERRKTLLRDAKDPNSGLSDRARKQILDSDGKKVPKGHEVSHEKPLYTRTTNKGKAKLDKADNMKTQQKSVHRKRHKVCGDQYHDFGPANKPYNPKP